MQESSFFPFRELKNINNHQTKTELVKKNILQQEFAQFIIAGMYISSIETLYGCHAWDPNNITCFGHADSTISNGESLVNLIRYNPDIKLRLRIQLTLISQALKPNLIQRLWREKKSPNYNHHILKNSKTKPPKQIHKNRKPAETNNRKIYLHQMNCWWVHEEKSPYYCKKYL